MKHQIIFFFSTITLHCAAQLRPAEVVAVEQFERKKPQLTPPGGTYLDLVTVKISGDVAALEWNYGSGYQNLTQSEVFLTQTTGLEIRKKIDPTLTSRETYNVVKDFPVLQINPPPGASRHALTLAISGAPLNVQLEIESHGQLVPYDPAMGLSLAASAALKYRQCSASRCSAWTEIEYWIEPNPAIVDHPLARDKIAEITSEAQFVFSQHNTDSLIQLLDAAKMKVLAQPALINSASRRSRFLAQDNFVTAQSMCTTLARFLYNKARRASLIAPTQIPLPEFAAYYIHHINQGDITTDAAGHNFNWVANGPALVTPYLPADAAQVFYFARSTSYPDDSSLLGALDNRAPNVTLLRDGPAASAATHTFVALKDGENYMAVDTYFAEYNGRNILRRFAPFANRFLHIVYGY